MTTRREQFNISALKFSDDVHDFLAELSRTRRLSDWISTHVEEELKRKRALMGDRSTCCAELMEEIQSIKQLLLQGSFQSQLLQGDWEKEQPVIQKISSDEIHQAIDETDLNYNF